MHVYFYKVQVMMSRSELLWYEVLRTFLFSQKRKTRPFPLIVIRSKIFWEKQVLLKKHVFPKSSETSGTGACTFHQMRHDKSMLIDSGVYTIRGCQFICTVQAINYFWKWKFNVD